MVNITPPEEGHAALPKKQVRKFGASPKFIFDLLLFTNTGFFICYLFNVLNLEQVKGVALGVNGFFLVFWFLILSPLCRIEIEGPEIRGRSQWFIKNKFPLRKINHPRTFAHQSFLAKFFYKDIWSIDGKRIRLWRKVIGRENVRRVMGVIQNYPFKEAPIVESAKSSMEHYSQKHDHLA